MTIGVMFGFAFFALPSLYLLREILRAMQSRSWPVTIGEIIKSSVERDLKPGLSGEPQHYAAVEYAYEVDGQRFTSNHIRFGAWLNPLDTDMRLVVATYPVGKRVVVRHHPAQPQIATLETRVSAFLWGMLVICVGMAGLIAHRALTGSW